MNRPALQVRPARPQPLAQVELLVLFHPLMQTGGVGKVAAERCAQAVQGWLIVDVHGTPARSELSDKTTIEDLRLEANGDDIQALLPSNVVDELIDYVVGDI